MLVMYVIKMEFLVWILDFRQTRPQTGTEKRPVFFQDKLTGVCNVCGCNLSF